MRTLVFVFLAVACTSSHPGTVPDGGGGGGGGDGGALVDAPGGTDGSAAAGPRTVFVIPMENESSSAIYGDTTDAPYINNTLVPASAYATMFGDELPYLDPSEPHYVWMEAGTNVFSDTTFSTDDDPSASNSTSSTDHLVTQLTAAHLDWVSYQEGITAGTCPIASNSTAEFAPKHDPVLFFQDVVGNPPDGSNTYCASHHKPYSALAADLAGGTLPALVYITPDLCHDMHGDVGCPSSIDPTAEIHDGDTWLSTELPPILAYANAHDSVVYLVWDEGSIDETMPFLAFGPHVHVGSSATPYTHSSQLKSIEEQLGVPVLPAVGSANDFADMFEPGYFP